jgi:hypothetical protein
MAAPAPRRSAICEIRELLEQHRGFTHCDACLALRLDMSLAESRAVALRLATEPSFVRRKDECYTCRRTVDLTAARKGQ